MKKCNNVFCKICKFDWKKNLGEIVSTPLNISIDEDFGYEDIRMFNAPIECGKLVAASADRERREYWESIYNRWGVTKEEVEAEFQSRVEVNYNIHNLHVAIFA